MSGHLDGPPPGPPDPPYIPGDLGAPSAEEFARRRASSEPRPENDLDAALEELVAAASAAVCEPRLFAENHNRAQWRLADAITGVRRELRVKGGTT